MNRQEEEEITHLMKIINVYEKFSKLCHIELLDAQSTISNYETELFKVKQELEQAEQREAILRNEMKSMLQNPKNSIPIPSKIKIYSKNESGFYSDIFYVIANLNLSEEEAEYHLKQVLEHSKNMSKQLGRTIGFRVAMLDYFLQNKILIKNPKIIEFETLEEIKKSSVIDYLTGVYNRRYFNEVLFREIKRCARYNKPLSLFIFDLDNFKFFNDSYGHGVGDKALQILGEILLKNFRTDDIIARIGGEEFGVILPEVKPENAVVPCERFAKRLKKKSSKLLPSVLTISGGIAGYPMDGGTLEELYIAADTYSYIAKKEGKDKIIVTDKV